MMMICVLCVYVCVGMQFHFSKWSSEVTQTQNTHKRTQYHTHTWDSVCMHFSSLSPARVVSWCRRCFRGYRSSLLTLRLWSVSLLMWWGCVCVWTLESLLTMYLLAAEISYLVADVTVTSMTVPTVTSTHNLQQQKFRSQWISSEVTSKPQLLLQIIQNFWGH